MRKFFEIGGVVAAVILIAFGIASIVVGLNGRHTVQSSLKQEQIVGSPDMTPTAIKSEAAKAGLPVDSLSFPTMAVAGKKIDTGDEARAFAGYMRIHALEATGGLTYAEMGRFQSADNPGDAAGTNDEAEAAKDEEGNPVSNGQRNIWINETALSTALNVSYMAEQTALFGIVVGIALLILGIGLIVVAYAVFVRGPTGEAQTA